jgi:hypothetical protein
MRHTFGHPGTGWNSSVTSKPKTSIPTHVRTGGRRQVRADAELVRLLHHGVDQCSSRTTRLKRSADAEHAQVHVGRMGVTGALDLLAP